MVELPQQKKGLFLTLLYALLVIVLIFLIGFDYKLIDYRWTSQGPFRHLAAVSVACVIVIFCSIFISFIAFKTASRIILIIFVIYQGLSMCLSFATTVITFMASSPGSIDEYIGCHSPLKGFVELWDSIDHYLIAADQLFCSNDCKCKIDAKALNKFKKNLFFTTLVQKFWQSDEVNGETTFQNCGATVHNQLIEHFENIDSKNYGQLVNDFDNGAFMKFWANIEKRFKCTGWCTTSYNYNDQFIGKVGKDNDKIPRQGMIIKYLFNDNSKEIPQYIGCMGEFIKYTKRMVKTYSSCLLIACFFQIITFYLGIGLLRQGGKSKEIVEEEKPKEVDVEENKI